MSRKVTVSIDEEVWKGLAIIAAKEDYSKQILVQEALQLMIELYDRNSFAFWNLYLPEAHWLKHHLK